MAFISFALFTAIFHLLPIPFPFFTPAKRAFTGKANFAWKVFFLHFISSFLHFFQKEKKEG
jgi:hypothetical protein